MHVINVLSKIKKLREKTENQSTKDIYVQYILKLLHLLAIYSYDIFSFLIVQCIKLVCFIVALKFLVAFYCFLANTLFFYCS